MIGRWIKSDKQVKGGMQLKTDLSVERVAEMAKFAVPLLFSIVGYYVSTQVAPINLRVDGLQRDNDQLVSRVTALGGSLSSISERLASTDTLLRNHLDNDRRQFATREELGRLHSELNSLRERLAAIKGEGA